MERYRWLLFLFLLIPAGGLGYTVLSLPGHEGELHKIVADNMSLSGVSNPVTAVLLNFRGYDTFLELFVLMLAILGVWSLSECSEQPDSKVGSVLQTVTHLLVPVLILVAGYLLWIGAHAPGGAFQAGSVLGAAGVLLILTGRRLFPPQRVLLLRLSLVAGTGTFLILAIYTLMSEGRVLEYPMAQAGILILIIETAATISIGVTLTALFLGCHPENIKDTK